MFDALIVRPFGWILRGCYNLFGSYGVAIILFTLISKIVLLPLQMKSKKSMMKIQMLQPKMDELAQRYGNDKEKYSLAVQKLYKQENVSLFGGCLPMLLMFPIMFGLYYAIRQPFTYMFGANGADLQEIAKVFTENGAAMKGASEDAIIANFSQYGHLLENSPGLEQFAVDFRFIFPWLDLSRVPTLGVEYPDPLLMIPVLSGLTAWFSGWMARRSQPKPKDPSQQKGKFMNVLMPCMSAWIAFMVPAGLGFYWILSNIFSAIQEPILTSYYKKKLSNNTVQEAQK